MSSEPAGCQRPLVFFDVVSENDTYLPYQIINNRRREALECVRSIVYPEGHVEVPVVDERGGKSGLFDILTHHRDLVIFTGEVDCSEVRLSGRRSSSRKPWLSFRSIRG